MWVELGFEQVDASVLSRVIRGERSFTAPQIKAFCKLLELPKRDEEYLFACLEQDQNNSLEQYVNTTRLSSSLALEVINELTKDSFDMLYRAEYDALDKRHELVRWLTDTYALNNDRKDISEMIGLNLYLKGRITICTSPASQIVKKVLPIYSQILSLSRTSQSLLLQSYAQALLGDAYYGAGG